MGIEFAQLQRGQAPAWDREHDETLVCLDVHQETHDVKSFTFASPEGKRFNFEAGQYFLFDFPTDTEREARCYSISSSPHRTNAFTVTVKRVAGGKVSNWLHDNMKAGMTVKGQGRSVTSSGRNRAGRNFCFFRAAPVSRPSCRSRVIWRTATNLRTSSSFTRHGLRSTSSFETSWRIWHRE